MANCEFGYGKPAKRTKMARLGIYRNQIRPYQASDLTSEVIIHQIFSLARDWSKQVTWQNMPQLKAMLHEVIFLATCNATNAALQVARKNSRVIPHFATAIVALRVARRVERPSVLFATLREKLLACNIPSATCNAILSEWANQSWREISAILFVIVRVASCEKSCKRVTRKIFYSSPLRCKLQEKLLRVTWP